ncbi:hypothetical protein [Pseudarthrobacter sp. NIBRBAC000502771]|uniref:hypothetical protein n=1 Tax=Pseudarthrobacter sp. NIBRBAC000502771 TaxID=2590774 RepID=UPI001130767B|nr:hypothetical protein [Pseudarthrobacter sp. NIBRBAC000502771]QDG62562.1 hypothetical protein NIBR502771_09670 [Pseudarthrobacter sp. NIBRBAC000502771]
MDQSSHTRPRMTPVIFLCLFAIAINAVLIQTVTTDDSALKNIVRIAALGLVIVGIIFSNARVSTGIILLILYSLVLLAVRQNMDQLSYIFVFILAVAMFAMEERKLEKILMLASLVSLALVFVFLAGHVTTDVILEPRSRHTYGTNGVPFFYNLVYGAGVMTIAYAYKYRLRGRLWVLVGSAAAASYLFQQTDARGGYYAFVAFVLLLFVVPLLSRMWLFRFAAAMLPVAFLFFAFYLASVYQDSGANILWSFRPRLFQRFFENVGLSDFFLSTSVKYFDRAVTIVDNSWIHLMVGGGAILCVLFFIMYFRAVMNLFEAGRHVEIAFIIATCIYFNSESIMLRIENMFAIYFWYLILRYTSPLIASQRLPIDAMLVASPRGKSLPKSVYKRLPGWATKDRLPVRRL